jgi:hypothetical protein
MGKIFLAIMVAFVVTSCVPPVVVPAKGYCIRYQMAWNTPEPAPVTKCVCEEDVYSGLQAILDAFTSHPDKIVLTGVVLPADCEIKKVDTDEEMRKLLSE